MYVECEGMSVMQSHRDVVRALKRGTPGVESNSMETKQHNDHTLLVGYGHAVYAVRTPRGEIVTFSGWANSSVQGSGGWRPGGRDYAGSATAKSNHFPHIPTTTADVLVAYSGGHTGLETNLRANADVVTDSTVTAAPQVSDDWMATVRDALEQA